MNRASRSLYVSLVLALAATQSSAIVIRHDRDDGAYRALAARYPAVGRVLTAAECVLIAPSWALTAAHVGEAVGPFGRTVSFGGRPYRIEKVILHPEWVSSGFESGRDVALLKLAAPVLGVAPVHLYAGDDETGKIVTFVGEGETGTGLSGPSRGAGSGLRGATNRVEAASETSIRFLFDAPPGGTELEGISGPGDSGGPALLERDGKLYTLGVSSANASEPGKTCQYGSTEIYARVSTVRGWIEETMRADPPPTIDWKPEARVGKGDAWPATPAGESAAAFFPAFNSGLAERFVEFNSRHRSEQFLQEMDRRRQLERGRELWKQYGRFEPYSYSEVGPLKLGVLARSQRTGRWHSLIFLQETGEPHRLDGIVISEAEAPK